MVICIDFTEVSHVVQVRAEGPGLGASALYLSLRPVTVGSGRAAYRSFTFPGRAASGSFRPSART